jgi:membrane protein YqaA with SNARE-associated domain
MKDTAIKGGIMIVVFVGILLALEYFLLDFNSLLETIVATYSITAILFVFLISETVLGLIPPEVFIAWASKTVFPWLFLFTLATMSYLGGIISYFIGNRLFLIPAIKNHIENNISKHIVNLKKWGGLFVLIGALLPIPHSIVSLACGLIKYKFEHYLLWALFRYLRFAIYALIIFQIF